MALVKHIFKHTSRATCGQKFVTVGHRQIFAKKDKKDLTGLDSNFFHILSNWKLRVPAKKGRFGFYDSVSSGRRRGT